jgi:hypothetical protein
MIRMTAPTNSNDIGPIPDTMDPSDTTSERK